MGIYKQGLNRKQQLMFPPSLDELVEEDNVVRAIAELGVNWTKFTVSMFCYVFNLIAVQILLDFLYHLN